MGFIICRMISCSFVNKGNAAIPRKDLCKISRNRTLARAWQTFDNKQTMQHLNISPFL